MAFARAQFELQAPQGDGASLRTHLLRARQHADVEDPRLDAQCPPLCRNLWAAFCALGRPGAGDGFTYITQQEIAAWQSNYRVRLSPWELETLRMVDHVAAQVAAAHQNPP